MLQKEEFVSYLMGYLPTLKLSMEKTQEFISALQCDNKNFKGYLKVRQMSFFRKKIMIQTEALL